MFKTDYLHLFFDDATDASKSQTESAENKNDSGNNGGDNSNNSKPADDKKSSGEEKKYSDADLDRIIEKKFAKWNKQKEAEVSEAAKLATMTEQEKIEHERDKLRSELEALKRANTIAEMEKTARGVLQESGVNVTDDIITCLVADDAETTSANVKSFAKAFKAAVQAEVKSQLAHKSPVSGSGTGKAVTREMIDKETDPFKRQQMIRDNMDLFRHKK